jgi:transcription initiation factor TFIIE subunit alpha
MTTASPLSNVYLNGKNTDDEIAEETEIRLNIVRRILYKLYDAGVASYKRSKDSRNSMVYLQLEI